MASFVDWAPAEWRVHVLFLSFLTMVLAGRVFRSLGLVSKADAEGIRKIAFNVALPLLLLLNMWKIELSLDLLLAVPACMAIQTLWAGLAYCAHMKQPADIRPWYTLTSAGVFMGYLYPFAAALGPEEAAKMMSAALIWDIGGNTWLNLFWLPYIVGRLVRGSSRDALTDAEEAAEPLPVDADLAEMPRQRLACLDIDLELDGGVRGHQGRERSKSYSGDLRMDEVVKRHLRTNGLRAEELDDQLRSWLPAQILGRVEPEAERSPGWAGTSIAREPEPEVEGFTERHQGIACKNFSAMLRPLKMARALWKPVPGSAMIGLLLNVLGVPLPPWIAGMLAVYGSCFTPLMFAVMGIFLRLDPSQFTLEVGTALLARIALNTIISLIIWALPLAPMTTLAWMMSAWSPMTSFVMVLTFEFKFDESRSACVSICSQVISFVAMWALSILVEVPT